MRTIFAYVGFVVSLSLDDWETREDFFFFSVSQVGSLSLKKKKNYQDRFSNVTDLWLDNTGT